MTKLNLLAFSFQVLKFLHLHPEQKFNIINLTTLILWVFSLIITAITVTVNSFNSHNLTSGSIQTNSDLMLSVIQTCIKLFVLVLHRKRLILHYFEMKSFWDINQVEIQEKVKSKIINSFKRDVIHLTSFYCVAALGQILYLHNMYRNMDNAYWDFLPERLKTTYYIIMLRFLTVFFEFCTCPFIIASDTLVVYSCINLNTQFQLVSKRLEVIINEVVDKRREVDECINYHKFLLRFAERMKEILSAYFVCIFFTTLYSLSSNMIFLARGSDKEQLAKTILFYILFLYQYSLYCFPMSDLTTAISEIGNIIYNTNWYLCDKETKQMIQFVILRSQKLFCMTAGGFINVDRTNFTQVFKTSLSLYSLGRVMAEQK